jgi:UDPglucose 6-dehydrogenase
MTPLEITIVGAGYVGLSSAVALALAGHRVHLIERNPERLQALQSGQIPFLEPDLERAFQSCQRNICIAMSLTNAVKSSSVVMLAVGTPPTPAHGADLSQVFATLEDIAPLLDQTPRVIVVKSTVPVGTNAEIKTFLESRAPNAVFAVASNPEFLRQGQALRDALFPDRIVLGVNEPWALEVLRQLYAPLQGASVPETLEQYRPENPIPMLEISSESAELAKYAANAFLAMKISFINEIANVCAGTEADVEEVKAVFEKDKRIGGDFLQAGLGYGGSCFPKDTRALSQIALRSGYEFRLLRAVIEVNSEQRFRVLQQLEQRLDGFRCKRIAVLGLTFKPDTDDLRESLGVDIALELQARGAMVTTHDPTPLKLEHIAFSNDLSACLTGVDAAILVTEWAEYQNANWKDLGCLMQRKLILDGRNALEPRDMLAAGFEYLGVGRKT